MAYADTWGNPEWQQQQANRIGGMGAGRGWGAMLVKNALGTATPAGAEFRDRMGSPGLDYLGIGKGQATGQPSTMAGPGSYMDTDPAASGSGNVPITNPRPIQSNMGQVVAGGPSGLSTGIGRYRPPSAMPAAGTFQNMIVNALAGRMNMPEGGLAAPIHASGKIGDRTFGDNPAAFGANQQLAGALPGFTDNFGGGRFSAYMQNASPQEKMTAATILRAIGQPGRIDWTGTPGPSPFVPTVMPGQDTVLGETAPPLGADTMGLLPGGQIGH